MTDTTSTAAQDGTEELSPLKRALLEIRDLRAKDRAAELRRSEPIAIVGTGLRFPGGATDRASYWAMLRDGVDAITEVPPDRWDVDALHDPDPDAAGKIISRRGGFVDGVDAFDAGFFGISHREAASMDPQQRLLLTTAWEALEDADIPPDSLFGTSAGVFVGIISSDYLRMLFAEPDSIDAYAGTGNVLSVAAGRIAYVLGTVGPAIAYDTACSASLVSVHAAVTSLRQGECDLALAGGAHLMLAPELSINHSRARMLAPDGRCKTFDARADGYGRSEGCGLVVCKRLSDAEADGDRILAVIHGSAVNQDGRSSGLTAPNGPSQERVIEAALGVAGIDGGDVSYVEAHGTGTPLGDPIELGAIHGTLIAGRQRSAPLRVGSVKTNIGHAEGAAGIAGLLKVVAMLEHGEIPPHLHLDQLNPYLEPYRAGIEIPTNRTPWPAGERPRLAGVSSFGLAGTNAHLVVGDPPAVDGSALDPEQPGSGAETPGRADAPTVLPLSARDDGALTEVAARWAHRLETDVATRLPDLGAAAALGRSHLDRRIAVVTADRAEAAASLRAFAAGDPAPAVLGPVPVGVANDHLVWLFTGHGSHHPAMGQRLYQTEPAFAAAIDRCAEALGSRMGAGLTEVLFSPDPEALGAMTTAQPALFALQYALAELWSSFGVRPTVVAGHSAGEYVAAVVAGALDLADGLTLVAERGRLMDALPETGAMAVIFDDEDTVSAAVAAYPTDIGIAAVNGPTATVVSGRPHAIEAVVRELGLDDDEWRRLDIPVAAHSPLVEPMLDEFGSTAAAITTRVPEIALVSSMTGQVVDRELTASDYWVRHVRAPVRFGSVFDTLAELGAAIFLELGPHPTLVAQGQRAWIHDRAVWAASMQRDTDEPLQVRRALGQLHVGGVDVAWDRVTGCDRTERPHLDLPRYPWQLRSYWAAGRSADAGPTSPIWEAAMDAAERRAGTAPLGLDVAGYEARWDHVDSLAVAAMVNAVIGLGLLSAPGDRIDLASVAAHPQLTDTHRPLVARWLGHLADVGVIEATGDGGFVAGTRLATTDLDALAESAAAGLGPVQPLVDYVLRCGHALVEVVTGQESALTTLFPDGRYDTVDFLYHSWDILAYYNGIVAGAVAAAVAARRGRRVRILEVGAGTGGTTAWVLPELRGQAVDYHFTDVSDFFLARARERFADHDDVHYGLLDLEHPPGPQGHGAGSYDLVVGANVLHATTDLDRTLGHVRDLLAPGGVLIALEGTNYPRWADVSTGLIEGWQRFDDDWRNDVPLIPPDRWQAALAANGFVASAALPADPTLAELLIHHVVMARAPGDEQAARGAAPPVAVAADDEPAESGAAMAISADEIAAVAAGLDDALDDERHDVLVEVVRTAIAAVLRTPDPASLDRDLPLLDLGFDSLMAVELRNLLQQGLSLDRKLPATLVFDHPSIRAIAVHLDGLLAPTGTTSQTEVAETPPSTADVADSVESAYADLDEADVEAALLAKLDEVES